MVCNVDKCLAIFTKYKSLYKHITRCHNEVYNDNIEDNADAKFNHNNENDIDDMDDDSVADIHVNQVSDDSDESGSAEDQVCKSSSCRVYILIIKPVCDIQNKLYYNFYFKTTLFFSLYHTGYYSSKVNHLYSIS